MSTAPRAKGPSSRSRSRSTKASWRCSRLSDAEATGRRILLAEDDEDDYVLIRDVFDEIGAVDELRWVQDGEELLDYLLRRNDYQDPAESPDPDLVLLDLNMPRKDGRTALREIREDERLRRLPVIVLTTSDAERDVYASYDLGANSYIIKPNSFEDFCDVIGHVVNYWFQVVHLPHGGLIERTDEIRS